MAIHLLRVKGSMAWPWTALRICENQGAVNGCAKKVGNFWEGASSLHSIHEEIVPPAKPREACARLAAERRDRSLR